jgi:hypothetical protein
VTKEKYNKLLAQQRTMVKRYKDNVPSQGNVVPDADEEITASAF